MNGFDEDSETLTPVSTVTIAEKSEEAIHSISLCCLDEDSLWITCG